MKHLRVAQRSFSLLLLFVSLVALFFFFQKWLLNLQGGLFLDTQSVRYLLSAISQCEAAIIGLVVTVTLIAVQLSATAYVPRVASIFRRRMDLWVLILIYGSSISYCLFLLNTGMLTWEIRRDLVFVAYGTFPAAFLMLIPYTSRTMKALDPRSVMQKLLDEATLSDTRDIATSSRALVQRALADDRVLSAEDMICASLRKEDFTTAMFGLTGLVSKIVHLADSYSASQRRHWLFSQHPISAYLDTVVRISKHLKRPGRIVAEVDRELSSQLVSLLTGAAHSLSKNRLHAEAGIVDVLASIGAVAVSSGNRELAKRTMEEIARLCGRIPFLSYRTVLADGKTSIINYITTIERVISALNAIGEPAAKKWGLISALDYCGGLAHVSMIYARKRGHSQDRQISIFPHEEPIMRAVIPLDHCMVDTLLASEYGLSTYVGEPLLYHRIIEPLANTARASYEKGYTAIGHLSDFGRTVGAIWHIGGAASLSCTHDLAEKIAKVLADLAKLDREVIDERMQHTMGEHYRFRELDLSLLQHLYLEHLAN